jgi:hypothetical protein
LRGMSAAAAVGAVEGGSLTTWIGRSSLPGALVVGSVVASAIGALVFGLVGACTGTATGAFVAALA